MRRALMLALASTLVVGGALVLATPGSATAPPAGGTVKIQTNFSGGSGKITTVINDLPGTVESEARTVMQTVASDTCDLLQPGPISITANTTNNGTKACYGSLGFGVDAGREGLPWSQNFLNPNTQSGEELSIRLTGTAGPVVFLGAVSLDIEAVNPVPGAADLQVTTYLKGEKVVALPLELGTPVLQSPPNYRVGFSLQSPADRIDITALGSTRFQLEGDTNNKQGSTFELDLADRTPPAAVTNLTAVEEETSVALSWINPSDEDLAEIIVRRSEGANPPGTPSEGSGVTVSGTEAIDSGLIPNKQYSYSVFTQDANGNTSSPPVTVTVTTKPAGVGSLEAVADVTSVKLTWTNPTPPPDEVIVRRSEGATSPSSPEDGVGVTVSGTGTGTGTGTDSSLTPNRQYSYSVFTKYGENVSDPATVTVTTLEGISQGEVVIIPDDSGLTSTIDFQETASCNADAVPFIYSVSPVTGDVNGQDFYTLAADWVVPLKTDIIPNSGETPYGNCLFEWTTEAEVNVSATPLMDYDGDGTQYDPEPIPGCVFDAGVAKAPPKEYTVTERPFCMVSDAWNEGTKTTTVLVWNDPKRFT